MKLVWFDLDEVWWNWVGFSGWTEWLRNGHLEVVGGLGQKGQRCLNWLWRGKESCFEVKVVSFSEVWCLLVDISKAYIWRKEG